jgi:hypothetical protein
MKSKEGEAKLVSWMVNDKKREHHPCNKPFVFFMHFSPLFYAGFYVILV